MNRRDFLFFRTEGAEKIAELSCEKLYMYFANINAASKFGQNESGIAEDAEWWSGEPSVVVTGIDQSALFESLVEDISKADVLIITDRQWLIEGPFADFVKDLLQQFSKVGGRVSYSKQIQENS